MEEKARSGDGHGQEEAGLGDREAERQLRKRGRRRRLQQASGSELGRREDHTAAEETQTGLCAAAAHFWERQLLIHGDIFTFCGGNETDLIFNYFLVLVFFCTLTETLMVPDKVRRLSRQDETCKYKTWVVSNRNDQLWIIYVPFSCIDIFSFFSPSEITARLLPEALFSWASEGLLAQQSQFRSGPWTHHNAPVHADNSRIFIYMFSVATDACALVYPGRLM